VVTPRARVCREMLTLIIGTAFIESCSVCYNLLRTLSPRLAVCCSSVAMSRHHTVGLHSHSKRSAVRRSLRARASKAGGFLR